MSNSFSAQYRIYYEDTDAGGIVYYANYLKFFERARTDFLRSLNIVQSELMAKENLVFVVRKCEVDYLTPARMDDLVEVSVAVTKINPASITMFQEMKKSDKVLSRLTVQIACVCANGIRPERIPNELVQLLTMDPVVRRGDTSL
ncbi:MAG: tol-pal system-associated acyl-CoA thioesterase [Rickettsiales bacterium]|nr:tol-pal system-associated acyl-CoA thioesterase [Rickettsiales bacterium]